MNNKNYDISIMRIVATIAVIFLHTCNTISNNASSYDLMNGELLFFTTGNYLMNWAVPVFMMITGALLLKRDKEISYGSCIGKYCKRIFLALVIFGIPFSILEIMMDMQSISLSLIPKSIINVLTGNSWSHLWYLYTLIGLYLILPILKTFVDTRSRRDMECLLVILLTFNFIFPFLNSVLNITIAFVIPIKSFAVFYCLLGKYLYERTPKILQDKRICTLIFIVSVIFVIGLNYATSTDNKEYFGYSSPLIVLMASAIFIMLKGCGGIVGSHQNIETLLWKLDRLCFGVYLIHPVFINFVYKFVKVTPLNMEKLYPLATVGFWLIFVTCAFAASWVMNLIKPLRKWIL